MSSSRGTAFMPSTLGLIGQLTEGSQRSSLLKRRTLRASTIPWLPEHRKRSFHLPADSGLRPRADRCLRQDEDFTLPSSWNNPGKEIQRETNLQTLFSPRTPPFYLERYSPTPKRGCMVADHAQHQRPTSELS